MCPISVAVGPLKLGLDYIRRKEGIRLSAEEFLLSIAKSLSMVLAARKAVVVLTRAAPPHRVLVRSLLPTAFTTLCMSAH